MATHQRLRTVARIISSVELEGAGFLMRRSFSFLLIAGVLLNESIVPYGPFVYEQPKLCKRSTTIEMEGWDKFMLDALQHRINQHQLLSELRTKLLRLHKMLLDTERVTYEQAQGKVSRGELLQLVIHHDQFAWLHRLSELIVQVDELLQADEPITSGVIAALVTDVRTLLTPDESGNDFATKYDATFQRNPDVVLAHADVVKLLAANQQ